MDLLTVSEAADLLRLSPSTIYGLVYQRRIPYRKHGSRLLFERQSLENYSNSLEISPVERCHSQFANNKSKPKRRSLKTK